MVMTYTAGMGDMVLHDRLPALWRRIEDAHYSYLETDDSPEKLLQKKKLEGYIIEYLSLVPHECKFGLAETAKVFQRTINELAEFSAYRAGIGWAALARYAGNLLSQPWRKEYKVIRLYSGFYKHEVEANMVGAESLLQAMGYRLDERYAGRLLLDGPACPDMVAAVSRDALIAHCECQIMSQIWEEVVGKGVRVSWADVARERASQAGSPRAAAVSLAGYTDESDLYSNIPVTVKAETHRSRLSDTRYNSNVAPCNHLCDASPLEEPITPIIHPSYVVPNMIPPHMMYPIPHQHIKDPVAVPPCNQVSMIAPYGAVPYYYPVQPPYMIPTPVYAPIKHATNIPVNGYPPMQQYRYPLVPAVPTAQLIELDAPSVYENGKFERHRDEERSNKKSSKQQEGAKRASSRSGFSDVTLPSLPRSDTQPALSKAKEDGMGTYESWDYVFRNLSSKDQGPDSRSGFSQSLDRDSRTLDRLDREERRSKYQPTTLDLEDGLQALNLDRTYDEEMFRTAKVNENLMRLKQEQESKKARQAKRQTSDERRTKKHTTEPVGNPKADGLIPAKVPSDKVKLLTKKEIKDRKDVIKQQSSFNGAITNAAEVKKVKKPTKLVAHEVERPAKSKPLENGVHKTAHSSKSGPAVAPQTTVYDLKQLVVSLDEADLARRSPPRQLQLNGERERSGSRAHGERERERERERDRAPVGGDKWQCATCTYLNGAALQACEMCGKSKRGPEIQPLTSGGRECPACTLVNTREAIACDACGTSLEHCPTYI